MVHVFASNLQFSLLFAIEDYIYKLAMYIWGYGYNQWCWHQDNWDRRQICLSKRSCMLASTESHVFKKYDARRISTFPSTLLWVIPRCLEKSPFKLDCNVRRTTVNPTSPKCLCSLWLGVGLRTNTKKRCL